VASLGEELYGRLRQRWFRIHEDSVQVENHSTKLAGTQAGSFDARAIVFDLDGVLVDTMPAIRAAWAEVPVLGVTNAHHESELRDAHGVIASLAQNEVVLEPTQDLRRMRVRWKHGIEHLHDPA
jgi:hypothetical protein